jgi:adenine deaminase
MLDSRDERRTLIDVAMGRKPADLVIRNGVWVCVQSGELLPGTDIACVNGRIAEVGDDISPMIGPDTQVIDAQGRYLVPGLLDGHMHVESGMLTITEFVRAVLPHGTTGMFIDPHEIANVFGMRGVKMMADEAAIQPIHVWVQMPSCVPSAPGLETPRAELGAAEVAEAMGWPNIIGLGEVMNFPGVASGDEKMLDEIAATQRARKVVGGHYASPVRGDLFHGYAAGGAEDDHEGTRLEDAVARARQGMKVMMRYGSAWHDVAAQVKAITEKQLDPRHFILCTDDCHAGTLIREGHMDRVLRHAIEQGLSAMTAIQMATINTAEHFHLDREMGQIAPGRWADILLVKNLKTFEADLVIAKGKVAAENGKLLSEMPAQVYPDWAVRSVNINRQLTGDDFRIHVDGKARGGDSVQAHVIGVIENQAPNEHLILDVLVNDGEIHADVKGDIAKLALVERHTGKGSVQMGLVRGFGLSGSCAVASTIAHDCHHMLVMGTNEAEMALAANMLTEVGGGQIVVKDGKVAGLVELAIGGLMSAERAERVSEKAASILEGFRMCGCSLNNPNMTMSLLALAVIPELRITDKGLVDVNQFKLIPVIEKI